MRDPRHIYERWDVQDVVRAILACMSSADLPCETLGRNSVAVYQIGSGGVVGEAI